MENENKWKNMNCCSSQHPHYFIHMKSNKDAFNMFKLLKFILQISVQIMFCLHQISFSSLWIQTQHINASICLRRTEWRLTILYSRSIVIIQTDLVIGGRCCVERVYMDAATGRLNGVGLEILMCVYQCHIRASTGRDGVISANLEVMISPGV